MSNTNGIGKQVFLQIALKHSWVVIAIATGFSHIAIATGFSCIVLVPPIRKNTMNSAASLYRLFPDSYHGDRQILNNLLQAMMTAS